MFLRAGVLSLALLLASRLLGVLRESAIAAGFGTSGQADAIILMLSLPDWLSGVLASGALAFVLLPAWAGRSAGEIARLQRRVARGLLACGIALGAALAFTHEAVLQWLAPGLPPESASRTVLLWSAACLPAAFLAALWSTRLQHERDFAGLYGGNLVVNATLVAAITGAALLALPVAWLGAGLVTAMLLRLGWLAWRMPPAAAPAADAALPGARTWFLAALSAGLPLALPFAARSGASEGGEGALATFNYAWKLVELPLVLAIQLVASLAFPAIARAWATAGLERRTAARQASLLAWVLACAAVAGLQVGAPAVASLLFGWGRMEPAALGQVAAWAEVGSWSLLPQALSAVAVAVLAASGRMHLAVWAHVAALAGLLAAVGAGAEDGRTLMLVLDVAYVVVAVVVVGAAMREIPDAWPWRALAVPLLVTLMMALLARWVGPWLSGGAAGLAASACAAIAVLAVSLWQSAELRRTLRP